MCSLHYLLVCGSYYRYPQRFTCTKGCKVFKNQNLILSRCESGFRSDFLAYVVNSACVHAEQD